jgi:hypothetical protein
VGSGGKWREAEGSGGKRRVTAKRTPARLKLQATLHAKLVSHSPSSFPFFIRSRPGAHNAGSCAGKLQSPWRVREGEKGGRESRPRSVRKKSQGSISGLTTAAGSSALLSMGLRVLLLLLLPLPLPLHHPPPPPSHAPLRRSWRGTLRARRG